MGATLFTQATTSGYRDNNGIVGESWDTRDVWSELLFVVDNYFFAKIASNKLHGPQTLKVRCETNMYNLYRGAAELDMEISEDNGIDHLGGGIVSPTIDQRGNSNDPDNSALTGSSGRLGVKTVFLLSFVSILLVQCEAFGRGTTVR